MMAFDMRMRISCVFFIFIVAMMNPFLGETILISSDELVLTEVNNSNNNTNQDTDKDGFYDSQDNCVASLQEWVTSSPLLSNHTYFDFKIDSQNRGHIAFHDPSDDTLRYGLYENGTLTTTLIDEGNQSGLFLSIVLNNADQPTIVYSIGKYWSSISNADRYAVGIADWNGTDWTKTKLEEYYYGDPTSLMSGYWNLRVTAHYGLDDELFVATITDRNQGSSGGWLNLISRNSTGDWNNVFTAYADYWESTNWVSPIHGMDNEAKTFALTTNATGFPFVYFSGDLFYPSNEPEGFEKIDMLFHQPPKYYTITGDNVVYTVGDRALSSIAFDSNNVLHVISQKSHSHNYNIVFQSVNILDLPNNSVSSSSNVYTSGDRSLMGGTLALKSDGVTVAAHGMDNGLGPVFIAKTSNGVESNRTSESFHSHATVVSLDSFERSFIAYDRGYGELNTGTNRPLSIVSQTGDAVHPHSDNDGCDDVEDAFPNDSTQWNDTDGDGYGDNLNGNNPDVFPNDSTQWNDTDGDGYGDNLNGNNPDVFPNDSTQWNDTDGDGYGDNLNGTNGDQLPLDPSDWLDFDSDGIGDSSDPDDDNDGYNDSIDIWQFDNCAWFDRDSDGKPDVILQGCNTPLVEDGDDDGDTKLDQDDFCPTGEINWLSGAVTDHDADGCRDDGEDIDDDNDGLNDSIDLCARGHVGWVSNPSADADNDGCHDLIEDNDDDNDGVSEPGDQCPNTPIGVTVDAQGCPLDSDSDGVADYLDNCSNTPSGVVVDINGCPVDSDGDGTPDYQDSFPNDANETADSDGDGVGDNSDSFPNDANETADSDGDGVGDNSDECQQSNPMDDVESDGCVLKTSTSETSSLVTPTIIGISTGVILLIIMAIVLIRRTGGSIEEERLFDQELIPVNSPLESDAEPEIVSQDTNPPESEIGILGDDGYYWLEWPSASGSWCYRAPNETIWSYFEK
jgi:hypothetical protein